MTSWLHQLPAAPKLAGLAVSVIGVMLLPNPATIAAAAMAVFALYMSAGYGPLVAWTHVRPLRWVVLILVTFQTLTSGWETAALVAGKLVLTVALAALLTLTTPMADLLDVIERGLRRVPLPGINPERIALVLALAIRAVPVVAGLAGEVRDAVLARGRRTDLRAYGVPLVVRCLRYSDALGEALIARGLDD